MPFLEWFKKEAPLRGLIGLGGGPAGPGATGTSASGGTESTSGGN